MCQEEILECENVVVRKCLGLIKVLALAVKWELCKSALYFRSHRSGLSPGSVLCKFDCKSPRLSCLSSRPMHSSVN